MITKFLLTFLIISSIYFFIFSSKRLIQFIKGETDESFYKFVLLGSLPIWMSFCFAFVSANILLGIWLYDKL